MLGQSHAECLGHIVCIRRLYLYHSSPSLLLFDVVAPELGFQLVNETSCDNVTQPSMLVMCSNTVAVLCRPPVVLPYYHTGMGDVFPYKARLPRVGHRVQVSFANSLALCNAIAL